MSVHNIASSPTGDIISRLYERYYLEEKTPESVLSSHWKNFGSRINVSIDRAGNINSLKGYGFGDSEPTNPVNRISKYLCNLTYFLRLPYKSDITILSRKAEENLKKIDSYLSYDSFRQICALCVIRKYIKIREDELFHILVIGDGYGFMSSLLKSIYKNAKITLVDIGKVLLFQAVNIGRIHPEYSHHLLTKDKTDLGDKDFLYVPAEDLSRIEGIKYTLVINIASMQEMAYEMINNYFIFMRSHVTEDNLFYCCNRVRKVLPAGEVIEFSRYPWQEDDKNLLDEICPFYKYNFSSRFPFINQFDGPFIHRAARLKTTG